MIDTRQKALEKARQRAAKANAVHCDSPQKENFVSNAGFVSEREKAKQALRDEVNAASGQNIRKIAAIGEAVVEERILRVAAYCRVSTDDFDQVISIEMQKNNYRDMIKANPKWKYAGTYVDDGFSGTNTEHRPAFRLMMRDAMAGKIDMIITKSVSRFARNLLDCIGWVRRLQEHEPPIPVFFEQENLNTLASTSNIILFVLAMVAEEESHMKSEAMLLSLEWRLSRGRFITPKLLGYDRLEIDDGQGNKRKQLVINEEQAQTVRLMYYMLLSGSSTMQIAETLTELHRETGKRLKDGTINTHWTGKGVACVMRNERYCGDVLARKTWTPNFHDHKKKKNNGKKNKYYQPAHLEAIVTRAQWNAAQRILNSHRYAHKGAYLPMRVIDRGALCGYISVNRSWAGSEPDEYYRASSIAMGLEQGELRTDLGNEHLPNGGHRIAGLTDDNGVQRIARELSAMEKVVKAQLEGHSPHEDGRKTTRTVSKGFQVVSAEMFTHAFEPIVSFTGKTIGFNTTCVDKLSQALQKYSNSNSERCIYVELLFNPVERMMVVRPCSKGHVNAVKWTKNDGRGNTLGASAFCSMLFSLLDWNTECSYRVPAIMQRSENDVILVFDLDNFIGVMRKKINKSQDHATNFEIVAEVQENTKGIFYAADEGEPQEIADIEAMEELLRHVAENEKRSFGTPAFEHSSGIRLLEIGDENASELMAEAIALDTDHRVNDSVVDALRESMSQQRKKEGRKE